MSSLVFSRPCFELPNKNNIALCHGPPSLLINCLSDMEAKLFCQTRNLLPLPSRHTHKLNSSPVVVALMRPADKINVTWVEKSTSSLAENFAGLATKTVHVDSWFAQLAISHLSKSVQAATGLRNSKRGYESLVQAARDASQKFSLFQQRELVIEALHGAIPKFILDLVKTVLPPSKFTREYFAAFTTLFFVWLIGPCEVRESDFNGRKEKNVVHIKKCRFLEETNCVGMCTNLCKVPTQAFIAGSLGMPVNMVPNFEDMSCEMIFGQSPPSLTEDPAFNQPCYKLCKSKQSHRTKCSS